jgi:hypothetical protein
MSKSISILAMMLIISSMTVVNAFDRPSASMAVLKNGSTIKLLYKGLKLSDVKVLIFNDNNQIVFAEKIKNTDGFVRPYNFSNLPEGNYSFQLTDNTGRLSERVSYLSERESKLMHVLRVGGTTDRFVLSVPNQGQERITITIYNDTDKILYTGKESITGDFARIYNLNNYAGRVTFVVTDSKGITNSLTQESW